MLRGFRGAYYSDILPLEGSHKYGIYTGPAWNNVTMLKYPNLKFFANCFLGFSKLLFVHLLIGSMPLDLTEAVDGFHILISCRSS